MSKPNPIQDLLDMLGRFVEDKDYPGEWYMEHEGKRIYFLMAKYHVQDYQGKHFSRHGKFPECHTAGCVAGTAKLIGLNGFEFIHFHERLAVITDQLARIYCLPLNAIDQIFYDKYNFTPPEKIAQIKALIQEGAASDE